MNQLKIKIHIIILFSLIIFSCNKEKIKVEPTNNTPIDTTTNPIDTTPVIIPVDTPIVIFFIGDSEPRMRNNTNEEIQHYIQQIIEHKNNPSLFFDYNNNQYPISPDIVLLGGDISADRSTSNVNDMPLWQALYDNGILFLAGFGNHDWDPDTWSDSTSGYSLAGHQSNENTKAFCRTTYSKSKGIEPNFSYTEMQPTSTFGPVTFYANYKGIKIVNFNTFLFHPSYYYPFGWPLTCNLLTGGAGCQTYVSAENQIRAMENKVLSDTNSTCIFFQHYPVASTSWWDDYGASNTTYTQKRDRLFNMITVGSKSILLTAHNHYSGNSTYTYNNKLFKEYRAPYFGGNNGVDYSQGGGFIALLVSKRDGILEIKTIE